MQTYRSEAIIVNNGSLTISGLPFRNGEKVEVVIRSRESENREDRYPLRGKSFRFERPFDGVAESEWDVTK